MKVSKTNRVNPSRAKNAQNDNFFITKKQTNKPSNDSSGSDNFVVTRKTTKLTKRHEAEGKKPFDKKKWRLQKYSKKYKLDQYEAKRKHGVVREYYRQVKDDAPAKLDVQKLYEEYAEDIAAQDADEDDAVPASAADPKAPVSLRKARAVFQKNKQTKTSKKEEALRKRTEREAALKKYKEKKIEKFKKLNKKTKKGQPVMNVRIEMLLDQIQASRESEI